MFCSSCGKQINDGARFCEHCGALQSPSKSVCSSCGQQINFGAKFCEHCGEIQVASPIVPAEGEKKSRYSQQEQSNIVGIAASLEASIKFEKEELKHIASECFREPPQKIEYIADWNKELGLWMNIKQAEIAFIQRDLVENLEALDVLYATTKIIPKAYRNVDQLIWLYEDMSSSEHDIERSIDMLNHKETSDLLRGMNRNVEDLKATLVVGFTAVYEAIQENTMIQTEILSNQASQQAMMQEMIDNQNGLLLQQTVMISQQSEMIAGLGRIRKSARLGNFLNVGSLIQNHKRNKMLSDIHNAFS